MIGRIRPVVPFLAVVCVVLVAYGAFDIWFVHRDHKTTVARIEREQAEAMAAKIGQFVKEIEAQLGWTVQLPWSAGTIDQRRFDGLRLLRQVPAITELAMIDGTGKEQLRVSRLTGQDAAGSGPDFSKDPKFTEAMAHKAYYGPLYFRRLSEPYMTLALAGARPDAGVSAAEINLKMLWDVASRNKIGEAGVAYIVDPKGRLIAHPEIARVLNNGDFSSLAHVRAALADGSRASPEHAVRDISGRAVLAASAPIAPLGWTVFVELPVAEANAPFYAAVLRSGMLLIAALVLVILSAFLFAGRMTSPPRKGS